MPNASLHTPPEHKMPKVAHLKNLMHPNTYTQIEYPSVQKSTYMICTYTQGEYPTVQKSTYIHVYIYSN